MTEFLKNLSREKVGSMAGSLCSLRKCWIISTGTTRFGNAIPSSAWLHASQMMGFKHYGFWSCMDTLKENVS